MSNKPQLAAVGFMVGALCAQAGAAEQDQIGTIEHEVAPYVVRDGKVDERTFLGWRLYHATCRVCHGVDAAGTAVAPDLTERVKDLTIADFTAAVLSRYRAPTDVDQTTASDDRAMRQALLEDIRKREKAEVGMPAWTGDPNVEPYVTELFAYLRARADGVLNPGRPRRIIIE